MAAGQPPRPCSTRSRRGDCSHSLCLSLSTGRVRLQGGEGGERHPASRSPKGPGQAGPAEVPGREGSQHRARLSAPSVGTCRPWPPLAQPPTARRGGVRSVLPNRALWNDGNVPFLPPSTRWEALPRVNATQERKPSVVRHRSSMELKRPLWPADPSGLEPATLGGGGYRSIGEGAGPSPEGLASRMVTGRTWEPGP